MRSPRMWPIRGLAASGQKPLGVRDLPPSIPPCMVSGVKLVVAFSPRQTLPRDASLTWLCHGDPDGPQGRRRQDPQKVPVAGQWAGSCPGCCPDGQGVFTHGQCPFSFEMTLWSLAHPLFERSRSIPTASHKVWGPPDPALGF